MTRFHFHRIFEYIYKTKVPTSIWCCDLFAHFWWFFSFFWLFFVCVCVDFFVFFHWTTNKRCHNNKRCSFTTENFNPFDMEYYSKWFVMIWSSKLKVKHRNKTPSIYCDLSDGKWKTMKKMKSTNGKRIAHQTISNNISFHSIYFSLWLLQNKHESTHRRWVITDECALYG